MKIKKNKKNKKKKSTTKKEKWKKKNRIMSIHTCDGDANRREWKKSEMTMEKKEEKEMICSLCERIWMEFWACGFPFIVMYCKLKYADMRAGKIVKCDYEYEYPNVWRLYRITFTKSKCNAHYSIAPPLWR